jgi:hypothetical protein
MSGTPSLSRRTVLAGAGLLALAQAMPAAAQGVADIADPVATAKGVLQTLESEGAEPCVAAVMRLLNKKKREDAELTDNLRPFSRKKPDVTGLTYDRNYNDLVRLLVFYAKYDDDRFPFMYFQFTFKMTKAGWTMTNFRFESESARAFPEGYAAP